MGGLGSGRPSGSKNKPKVKTVRLTNTQIALGKKLGVSPEEYARSLIKIEKQEKASLARKKRASNKKWIGRNFLNNYMSHLKVKLKKTNSIIAGAWSGGKNLTN